VPRKNTVSNGALSLNGSVLPGTHNFPALVAAASRRVRSPVVDVIRSFVRGDRVIYVGAGASYNWPDTGATGTVTAAGGTGGMVGATVFVTWDLYPPRWNLEIVTRNLG
jgi:hypothetical protein